jgi:hypothetical protein
MGARTTTTLGDFGRSIRNEPAYGIYKHRFYLAKDTVPAAEVEAWLRKAYVEARSGRLYRVVKYRHADGNHYVDYIWMQKCTDNDEMFIKMNWGFEKHKIARGERVARRKLTKEQKSELDELIAYHRRRFYEINDEALAAKEAQA